jgi:ABC-2 type transport system ATP-binding protein
MDVTFAPEGDGIHVETKKEKVPEIVTALAGAGVSVYGMDTLDAQSLEDVFMKLTGEVK